MWFQSAASLKKERSTCQVHVSSIPPSLCPFLASFPCVL
uniref:Uncharacterized protein n=1 Tax=Anguilla anguilla TaxID=7936 RepID=A0A0E9PLL2_ANGAN